jgi:hypothetical protein
MRTNQSVTQGVVIFAYANELIDYVALAAWSTLNIHRHLGLPVCVITDQVNLPPHYSFDQVVITDKRSEYSRHFSDYDQPVTWYNRNRMDAFELSPWDQTLVLDADYVVASDQLLTLFDSSHPFLAHDRAHDVTGAEPFDTNRTFGQVHMPMSWATVMLFNRTSQAKRIFDAMAMIRDNWHHYRALYSITPATYRNDHALSIAQLIVNGQTLSWPSIPWSLASVTPSPRVTQLALDQYRVDYNNAQGQPRWITVNQDFHVMGKRHLGDIVADSQ